MTSPELSDSPPTLLKGSRASTVRNLSDSSWNQEGSGGPPAIGIDELIRQKGGRTLVLKHHLAFSTALSHEGKGLVCKLMAVVELVYKAAQLENHELIINLQEPFRLILCANKLQDLFCVGINYLDRRETKTWQDQKLNGSISDNRREPITVAAERWA